MKQKIILSIFLILVLGLMIAFVYAQENGITSNIVKEQVKCVFENSNKMQKCYTDDGKFGCSGTGTCIADVKGERGTKQIWKSSCGGYDYTLIDGNNDYAEFRCPKTLEPKSIVTEKVKCVFENSNEIQKCSTDDSKFGCSGTGTCVADVKGEKGTKQIWKSSCKGDAYTIIDGDNDYAEFKCPETLKSKPIVKEQVKCVFENSNEMQKCYTDDGKFGCSGTGTCVADVKGEKGTKQIWKSSCGGYDYTLIGGDINSVKFKCISELKVTEKIIGGKGFRYAYWQCSDKDEEKQGSESSCKLSRTWKKYATEFCQEKCNEDNSKCGVNSFSITEECYLDFGKKEVVFVSSIEEEEKKQEKKIIEEKQEILICKDSCPSDGKCYPFGYRKSEKFCSDTGSFIEQSKGNAVCENNFECSSNLCVDSQCISQGFFKKIMNWFSKFFG